MVSFRIIASKNHFDLLEPRNDFDRSLGYYMVVNPEGEVLKFFKVGSRKAHEYLDYVSLSRWEKVKYWWNYKRS